MPTTTSRLSLLQPVGADAVSEYRLAMTANATTLDGAAIYKSGTLAAIPAAASTPAGTVYQATDTAQWFLNSGTTWSRIGGRQYHAFTMDDQTSANTFASVLGSFFVDPDQGETVTLVELIVHCATVGSTPSTFSLKTDHGAHGTLTGVAGLTALTPSTTATIVTPTTPLVFASLDRVALVATNAASGNSKGCTVTVVTQHSP